MMKGFTLVETLIAITVLATAIVGPYVAVQNAITASYAARDQLIASALAQEAVEYVRSVRDDNYLERFANPGSTHTWFEGLDGTGGGEDCFDPNPNDSTVRRCVVDPTGNSEVALCGSGGTGTCPVLKYSPTTSVYTQASGYPDTKFTRSITLVTITETEVQLTVRVTWETAHKPYIVEITEHLHDWL